MVLRTKRLDEVIDGGDGCFVGNAMVDFASVSCGIEDGSVKFTLGYTDMDGDVGSLFYGLKFNGKLGDFLSGLTAMICQDLLDDEDREVYLEDLERTPIRVVTKANKPVAVGHFLHDRFIVEDDVREWIETGGVK